MIAMAETRSAPRVLATQQGTAMPLWGRSSQPVDLISSEHLASYGRIQFLGSGRGPDGESAFDLIRPINERIYTGAPADRRALYAELERHAAVGAWEQVGAWKYVRDMLDDGSPESQALIDGGLRRIHRMRVTNLSIHIGSPDSVRYSEVNGEPPMMDGFWGPPVFDSEYGPSRQYYYDHAVAAAAGRVITRLPAGPGVAPGPLDNPAGKMWDFGMFIYRGPLAVSQDHAYEPALVRSMVKAASNVDHGMFADALAEDTKAYVERDAGVTGNAPPWSALGGTRFVEDYLDPSALDSEGYAWLLDKGVDVYLASPHFSIMMTEDVMTPRQRARLEQRRGDL
jgi:hypothetical protein